MSELRVILSGGGTGGHVFPAIAVAQALKARRPDARILFIGTERGIEAQVVPSSGFPIRFVKAKGLSRRPLQALEAIAENLAGMVQALRHVLTFSPQVVVGSGGYVSVPVNLAAWLTFKPTVLLEQNVVPGKATKLLSLRARKVCVSFHATAPGFGAKAVLTGNPVREEIVRRTRDDARQRLGIPADRFCLLVTGASQGARSVNEAVLGALPGWRDRPWHVLHLAGRLDFDKVRERATEALQGASLTWEGRPFLEDMASAYAAADLVVARAGATTLAEITSRGLPAILIPYPHAGAHQVENARSLEEAGGAVMVLDERAAAELPRVVVQLVDDPARRARMAEASASAGHPDAAARIAEVILQVAERSP
jgi:UDP-N-acetylglucosamine--N-acetylmuramyl-(pentapeptide) pyrophosphoryl-undecaprenol N-acetylglucosamine transferase